MRTLQGSTVHRQLMLLAKDHLEKQGYTVMLKAQLGDSASPIDVLGIKNGDKVAIECQLLPSQAILKRKLELLKPYVGRLMLAVPKNVTPRNIPAEIEVLKLEIEKPMPQGVRLHLTISKEARELVRGKDVSRMFEAWVMLKFGPQANQNS